MRKMPRQPRALATMDAIVEAAAHILVERGWRGLSTNAVAERAGVSIGSLYQYFPNKISLIEFIRQQHFTEVLSVLQNASNPEQSRTRRLAALIDGMIEVHKKTPAVYRVLFEECPRSRDANLVHRKFEAQWRAGYEAVLAINSTRSHNDIPMSAMLFAGAMAGAIHEAARRNMVQSSEVRNELMRLVDTYLSVESQ
jgi:AcrR family transcriptional regulator